MWRGVLYIKLLIGISVLVESIVHVYRYVSRRKMSKFISWKVNVGGILLFSK